MERVPEKSVAAENMYTEKYHRRNSLFLSPLFLPSSCSFQLLPSRVSLDRATDRTVQVCVDYVIGVEETIEKQNLRGI